MKRLDVGTLETIAEIICGSATDGVPNYSSPSPYRTMSEIQAFFARAGVRPTGISSTRKSYVVESLRTINGERDLKKVLMRLASPREYKGNRALAQDVTHYMNRALRPDGLEIVITIGEDPEIRVRTLNSDAPPQRNVRRETQIPRANRTEHSRSLTEEQATSTGHDTMQSNSAPTTIFIGHGHSMLWRQLKDFLEERLELSVDEYSRVSNAGRPTTERLSEMLDSAMAAFLLMTGEDETAEGELRARENVVHEAGLFQGRLGFTRAIVLLEDGCEEFSNIVGLGQIRFPKGNISPAYEDIRMFLERENIIKKS